MQHTTVSILERLEPTLHGTSTVFHQKLSMQVQPFVREASDVVTDTSTEDGQPPKTFPVQGKRPRRRWQAAAGYVYLACTITGSIQCALLFQRSATNDYYWPGFNTSGIQTYLADLYNRELSVVVQTATELPLDTAIFKDYSATNTVIDLNPSRARGLLLSPLPLPDVIASLRKAEFSANLVVHSPFCWVDFGRSFELAQTAARQRRCNSDRAKVTNAARYLDSILRNTPCTLARQSMFYPFLNATIFSAIAMSPPGQVWLDEYTTRDLLPLDDELAHWQHVVGLTSWVTQVTNAVQLGIEESIAIVSALGRVETIQINRVAYAGRVTRQTTDKAFLGFAMHLFMCSTVFQCSLVRGAPNHVDNVGISWDELATMGARPSVASRLIRQQIGPFGAMDVRYDAPPAALKQLVHSFRDDLSVALRVNEVATAKYTSVRSATDVHPTPPAWADAGYAFYGGNPMCMNGWPQPFVQSSFGFYDSCGVQSRLTVQMNADPTLMAFVAMFDGGDVDAAFLYDVCAFAERSVCTEALAPVHAVYDAIRVGAVSSVWSGNTIRLVQEAWVTLMQLNVSLIQFATDSNLSEVLLVTPWISSRADAWSFYGWIAVYEWVHGLREVYSFEGDKGSFTTISPRHDFDPLAANPLELPQTACNYVRYINVYVSMAMAGIAMLVMAYGAADKFSSGGLHLFQFNRVVGSVWIGRPCLLLRGMTAIVVLSTANVAFVAPSGFQQLRQDARSLLDVALLAGETTWLTYVAIDVFLPLTQHLPVWYSPVSSGVAWMAVVGLELVAPVAPVALVHPRCILVGVDTQVDCDNGSFSIGSVARVGCICLIQASAVAASYAAAAVFGCTKRTQPCDRAAQHHLLLPVASQLLLAEPYNTGLTLDHVGCVMSGMLPMGAVFDVKLWMLLRLHRHHKQDCIGDDRGGVVDFPNPTFRHSSVGRPQGIASTMPAPPHQKYRQWIAVAGVVYMAATVGASYLYLELTESTMANDFWWKGYNVTGAQTFLSNWFIRHLTTATRLELENGWSRRIDDAKFGDPNQRYNSTFTTIFVTTQYGNSLQDHVNSLENVIRGLRQMDGCDVPWIFTPYCYVDFAQTWEMANSVHKQQRCAQVSQTNGAVYLESVLRNAQREALQQCWGDAVQTAIFDAVQVTRDGQAWVERVRRGSDLAVIDEAASWRAHGIVHYTTQWQNFKILGVHEVYSIENALGVQYDMTLRLIKRAVDMPSATSFKMYWGFANDLVAVANCSTLPSRGMSLVRQSNVFAFENHSAEQLLVDCGHLTSPLAPTMALVRDFLGPFGSTDVYRVAVPASLTRLYQELAEAVVLALVDGPERRFSNYSSIRQSLNYFALPPAWATGEMFLGGNLFGLKSGRPTPSRDEAGLFAVLPVYATKQRAFMAVLAMGLHRPAATASPMTVCSIELQEPELCESELATLQTLARETNLPSFGESARAVKADVVDNVHLEIVQFLGNPVDFTTRFAHDPVFSDPHIEYFAWLVLFQWVLGELDVVRVVGSTGDAITIASASVLPRVVSADPLETPVNVAYYIRCCIRYVTLLLLVVASLTGCTIVGVRGHVENWNMLQFNRVAGLVWIGRPLIFLRAVTAICLLSTPPLDLTVAPSGLVTYLTSPPRFWLTTLMSCGEMSWLVYIVNDLMSPLTRRYTALYAPWCSLLVWVVTWLWTLTWPVFHVVHVARTCIATAVDFDVACHSGTLYIGRISRFLTLVAITFACCLVCYVVQRRRFRTEPRSPPRHRSYFLHAVARHHLTFRNLQHDGVEYLDKASAILSGLLCVHVRGVLYIFDVKSWRPYAIDTSQLPDTTASPNHRALSVAIPLLE
ncbi:hypothetical protein DYB32_004644 [Aphanomyces invadans]|uniref:Uncharacterized protein n=1 Tax=Aphanomyces invadans TaxID=157072 RepID=A0A3R7A9J1_9STRA|nr:hypothetical protein DYB32_004644 [Aphanomyces invadans]